MKRRSLIRRREAGVSIVTAVFLLVVLSALGVAIVTLSTGQQKSAADDLLGSRAYEAARSGMEYGLYQMARNGQCAATTSFSPGGALAAFTVTVQCASVSTPMGVLPNGTQAPDVVQTLITASACNQPANGACPNPAPTSADYIQRVVQVR